jgi:cbb3-type cytochrome oxidase subunit 3
MPLLDLFWTMLIIFLWIIYIWLLITIFIDLFRSDMSGFAKAIWVIVLILFTLIGVLVYLIVNGDKMRDRQMEMAKQQAIAQREYIQEVAGSGGGASSADELAKLADLHKQGVLTDDEFAAQKAKLLS